jgi:hypothetical protein
LTPLANAAKNSRMDAQQMECARRLRRARAAKYPSASAAARAMSMVVSSYIHHENGTRPFALEDAVRYGKAFDVQPAYLLGLAESGELGSGAIAQPPISAVRHTAGRHPAIDAAVDAWREIVAKKHHTKRKIAPPDLPGDLALKEGEYAVRVVDGSVDKAIPAGSYAICAPIRAADVTRFHVDDLVHIERIRRGFQEISIRLVRANDGRRLRLGTYSADPEIEGEVAFPSARNAGEEVRLIGLVVGIFTSLRP